MRERLNKVKEREFGAEAVAAASADISAAAANRSKAQRRGSAEAEQTNDMQEAQGSRASRRERDRAVQGGGSRELRRTSDDLSDAAAKAKESAAKSGEAEADPSASSIDAPDTLPSADCEAGTGSPAKQKSSSAFRAPRALRAPRFGRRSRWRHPTKHPAAVVSARRLCRTRRLS